QESFLRLWKQWQGGSEILNPRAWLLRVARNLAEDYAKSSFRRNGTHPPQTMNGVSGRGPLPLEYLERAETFGQLRAELATLAASWRPQSTRRLLWFRQAARLALAASIALFLIGYLALASLFPRADSPGLQPEPRHFGKAPHRKMELQLERLPQGATIINARDLSGQ